jgi:hypothetical protein
MKLCDIDDPDLLRKFKKAIKKAGDARSSRSELLAPPLRKEGFITKSGRLTKNYGG